MGNTWIELEAAQKLILDSIATPTTAEEIPLEEALHRVCAKDVFTTIPLPPFRRSPLDGFALHSQDSTGVLPHRPVCLPVLRTIFAGDAAGPPLPMGHAVRIMTGAALPNGADCVVRQEDVTFEEEQVVLRAALAHEENIVFCGEDLAAGQLLCPAGEALSPAHISLLAGQGLHRAAVRPLPVVAVASTGSELAAPGQPLPAGKIYDSNSLLLATRVQELGGTLAARTALPDDPEALHAWLHKSLSTATLTLTTGGVSVGQKDYLPAVAQNLGGTVLFHGVNLKPGGPALALSRGGNLLLCLSGNPFAALATFEVLGTPALKKLAGHRRFMPKRVQATAAHTYTKHSPGRRLIRAKISGSMVHIPPLGHASGMLHSFCGCNCFIDLPPGSHGVQKGASISIILLA